MGLGSSSHRSRTKSSGGSQSFVGAERHAASMSARPKSRSGDADLGKGRQRERNIFIRIFSAPGRFYSTHFPERQIFFRSRGEIRYVSLPGWLQISAACGVLSAVGWIGFSTGYFLSFDNVMERKDQQVQISRSAHQAVVQEVDRYQVRFATISRNLEERRDMLAQLISRVGTNPRAGVGVESADKNLFGGFFATGPKPAPGIAALRGDWNDKPATMSDELWLGFDRMESELKSFIEGHATIVGERNWLRSRVTDLEMTLASFRASQVEVLRRVTESTSNTVVAVEKLIAMTGLDVDNLLSRLAKLDGPSAYGLSGGQGGPFVELAALSLPPGDPLISKVVALDEQMLRWQNLQRVLRTLPLAAPVDHYRLTSGFGRRVDPLRKRWAHHSGVDLASRSGTSILAVAPGRVVSTGWRGNYGRTIVIDHGLGVRTRYSHLRKILVKKGQKVEFRDKIALMGSSGRSTGTHLHYEVRVDDKPLNPIKFMRAGKYVFKGK